MVNELYGEEILLQFVSTTDAFDLMKNSSLKAAGDIFQTGATYTKAALTTSGSTHKQLLQLGKLYTPSHLRIAQPTVQTYF